ncbi:acyltransferase [Terrilactibacillus laevilacticus]|uniref:acyltransferase n=1 Tax=Terrilactibacillus laevilacticus TaxID=1380157 RepID=UPI001146280B|nr:acyltransferase [Terrilactibacillus laevilacticus]
MYEYYIKNIQSRNFIKRYIGLITRYYRYLKIVKIKRKFTKQGAILGENVCIGRKTTIHNPKDLIIGDSTVITGADLDARGRLMIGSNCIINDGVRILSATHNYNSPYYELEKKEVEIKDFAWLATDSKILPGVCIGKGAIVGAGSVVAKDIPDMAIAIGNPCKIIGYRTQIHDGIPTEILVGGDFKEYSGAIKKRSLINE